jgi:hypothetical protein
MPLTLRPTGLQQSAAFAHRADWVVFEDGKSIGRIYCPARHAREDFDEWKSADGRRPPTKRRAKAVL